jgi:cell division protein ZapB
MDADLKALEDKISQLVELCRAMRQDNVELKQALAIAQDAERQLKEKMQQAGRTIEEIIDRLPEDVL